MASDTDVIVFNDERHANKIAERAQVGYNPITDICIARVKEGRLLGGVLFTNYTGHSIAIHTASFEPRWINRDLLWITFHYPFVQLGCKYIFGQVALSNKQALAFDLNLGFKVVAEIDDVFADGGVSVVKMSKDDCRWLDIKPRTLFPKE